MAPRDERGATLIVVALALTGMIAVGAMTIDGAHLYYTRRQAQNAADAAALAGARALDRYQRNLTSDVTAINTAVQSSAAANGNGSVTCTLVDFNRTALGACPTSAPGVIPAAAAGVTAKATMVQPNGFANVLHFATFTAQASATAEVGKPGGADAPLMVCASDPQDQGVAILTAQNGTYSINSGSVGKTYTVWGNDVKQWDCGDASNSFRGLVNQSSGPYSIPGVWQTSTGNKTGPTVTLVGSGTPCDSSYAIGCVMVLPLCPYASSNGLSGQSFALYCTDLGLFQVVSQNPPKNMKATFLGATVLVGATGGITGPADANGARVIGLTS